MRALWLVVLVGCSDPASHIGECEADTACAAPEVCARSRECASPSELRTLKVTWTIGGQAASAGACTTTPELYLWIYREAPDDPDTAAWAPVPCVQGQFFVDRLPFRYTQVQLGYIRHNDAVGQVQPIGAQTELRFDLQP